LLLPPPQLLQRQPQTPLLCHAATPLIASHIATPHKLSRRWSRQPPLAAFATLPPFFTPPPLADAFFHDCRCQLCHVAIATPLQTARHAALR